MSGFGKESPDGGDGHVPAVDWKAARTAARKKPKDKTGAEITKSQPAPLYVYRNLLNAADVIAWAKAEGFKTCLPAESMHTTITYSKAAIDWMAMGESWSGDENGHVTVHPGGPRVVSQFNQGAVVLQFACDTFEWRHRSMVEAGASFDFAEYRPHLTLSYSADGVDLEKVTPYQGKLIFGPEVFEEIKGGFDPSTIVEKGGRLSSYCKVAGVNAELGLVFGWGIICKVGGVDYVDVHKNHVPEEAMVEATTEFMKSARVAGDMHERGTTPELAAGCVVHSFPLTTEIAKAMGIETGKTGWMIAMAPDAAMLAKFKSGEYTGFSIGGEHIEIDGMPVEVEAA